MDPVQTCLALQTHLSSKNDIHSSELATQLLAQIQTLIAHNEQMTNVLHKMVEMKYN